MRKLLFLLGLVVSFVASAQNPTNYSRISARYRWTSAMYDSMLYVPRYNGTPSGVRVGEVSVIDGAVAIDTANSRMYMYSGGAWVRLANYSEIGGTYTAGDGLLLTALDFKVLTKRSITIDNDSLMLVNDSTASPVSYFYGTNVAGRKGWYAQSGITGVNIYNSDGTLTGDRTIDGGGNRIDLENFTGGIHIGYNSSVVDLASGLNGNDIQIYEDSTLIRPYKGQMNIDSLRSWTAIADSAYKRIMTWDERNGRWEYFDGYFPTAGDDVNIYNSDGTLTGGRTVTAAGNDFTISGAGDVTIDVTSGKAILLYSGNNSVNIQDSHTTINYNGGGVFNEIKVSNSATDGVQINPHLGNLEIDTLNYTLSTTGKKIMLRDTATGLVQNIDPALIGGGSQTPWTSNINADGYTLNGNDGANEDLTIQGTSHATKATSTVVIQGSGGNVGIGTSSVTSPYAMEIKGSATNTSLLNLNTAESYPAWLNFSSAFGRNGYFTGNFKGVNYVMLSDGNFVISSGATAIQTMTVDGTLFGRRIQTKQGADVASAAGAITLGTDGNTFEITGTAAITLISNVNWQNGSVIYLVFTSTATLTDGTANSGTDIGMELAGGANFTGSADDVVTLVLSEVGGTQRWREAARSVNGFGLIYLLLALFFAAIATYIEKAVNKFRSKLLPIIFILFSSLSYGQSTGGNVLRYTDGSVQLCPSGGTVTQATNKATAVTLNKLCGQITTTNAALAAAAEVKFTVTNNTVGANDIPFVAIKSGGTSGSYVISVGRVADGSFDIVIGNMSTGSKSEALVINFIILKSLIQ